MQRASNSLRAAPIALIAALVSCTPPGSARSMTYVKASYRAGVAALSFGYAVAVSADGSTLAVGAWTEPSRATGIDGDQTDFSAVSAGAVYVFTRSGGTWSQQAYIKASNTGPSDAFNDNDQFGWSVALSGDGSTLAVGAPHEASSATGIDGDQTDDSLPRAGAVYVFARAGSTWSQTAYVKSPATTLTEEFGATLALSGDASTLAVGTGACMSVYVLSHTGSTWAHQSALAPVSSAVGDLRGCALAVSSDGSTLAIGTPGDSSDATGIDGSPRDHSIPDAGAVTILHRAGTTWSQEAWVKASNTGATDAFGVSVALSGDGSTLAVGAADEYDEANNYGESSPATGIGGDQTSDAAPAAGAVYVFTRAASTWSQQAYVKASNTNAGDYFGNAVSLSFDGATLAVGAVQESSDATGVGGDQANNRSERSGAVYVLERSAATWSQGAYVKASNTDSLDAFGHVIALSADGQTLVVGAPQEASIATGIDGDQADNSRWQTGAVYVYSPRP